MNIIETKICTKCQRDLPFTNYHKHATAKYGLRPKCKDCIHQQRTEYYERTQERSQEYSKNYYTENADAVKKYQRRYVKKNRSKVQQYSKIWRAKNREKLLVDKKTYFQENKERLRVIGAEYQKQHPEYCKTTSSQRRAEKFSVNGSFTAKQLLDKCIFYGWNCFYCHIKLELNAFHIDHLIPLSKGGTNWISNIVPCCAECNLKKGTKTYKDFVSP